MSPGTLHPPAGMHLHKDVDTRQTFEDNNQSSDEGWDDLGIDLQIGGTATLAQGTDTSRYQEQKVQLQQLVRKIEDPTKHYTSVTSHIQASVGPSGCAIGTESVASAGNRVAISWIDNNTIINSTEQSSSSPGEPSNPRLLQPVNGELVFRHRDERSSTFPDDSSVFSASPSKAPSTVDSSCDNFDKEYYLQGLHGGRGRHKGQQLAGDPGDDLRIPGDKDNDGNERDGDKAGEHMVPIRGHTSKRQIQKKNEREATRLRRNMLLGRW